MRRLLVLAAALALLVPSGAAGKGTRGALRVCGSSGCEIVGRHLGHDSWELLADLTGGAASGPALPGPFYRLSVVPIDERGRPQVEFPVETFFYAPRGKRVRVAAADGRGGVWRALDRPPRPVASAVRRLRPFPAPLLVRVEVDGRIARDPQSYLRLFRLASASRQIADPAGPYPSNGVRAADTTQIVRYWRRVDRHWLPVNLWSRRPSPWGDDATSLWVARRLPLVKRDGEIVRVSGALAERVRRARSLR